MTRPCATADCRRAAEPGWSMCDQHVRDAITNAFGPDRPQDGTRHADVPGTANARAVLLAATA